MRQCTFVQILLPPLSHVRLDRTRKRQSLHRQSDRVTLDWTRAISIRRARTQQGTMKHTYYDIVYVLDGFGDGWLVGWLTYANSRVN